MADANGREPKGARRSAGPAGKMMLAFVIRQCEIDLGHPPTAAELARWSNRGGHSGRRSFLFGRPITEDEARIMLRRQTRLVTVRAVDTFAPADTERNGVAAGTVIPLAQARERLVSRRRRPARAERRRR